MDSSNTNVVEVNRVARFALRGAIGFGLGAIVAGIGASSAGLFATLCGVLSGAVGGALLGWRRKTRRAARIAAFGFAFGFLFPGCLGRVILMAPHLMSSQYAPYDAWFAFFGGVGWGVLLAIAGAIGAPFLSSGRTIVSSRSRALFALAGGLAFGIGGTIGGATAFTLYPNLVQFFTLFYGLSYCIGGALLGAAVGYLEGPITELKDDYPRGLLSTLTKSGLVIAAAVLGILSVAVYLVFSIGRSGHSGPITSAVFSSDGTQILTGSMDNTAKLWDTATGRKIRTYSGHGYTNLLSGLIMDSRWPPISFFGEWIGAFKQQTTYSGVYSVAFSPDGKQLLTGGTDSTAKLWDKETGQELRTFSGHQNEYVWSVAFSPDGTRVLTSSDKMAKLWDASTGAEIRTFTGHWSQITSVAFSPEGTQVLTGSLDNSAKLWDVTTGDEIRTIALGETGPYIPMQAVFSPDGTRVLTSSDKMAKLWDASTGAEIRTFTGHWSQITSVAFSPDGTQVLTGSVDNSAKLWDVTTGDEVRTYAGVRGVAFSPDGTLILTIGTRRLTMGRNNRLNTVTLLDAATGDEIRSF